jgi:UDP-N-acetylglucosamine--N-acetylmuramyl-(pentapeptide) pyrophosphoryl-undecaprenol N-acetylglucosamine transferase
MKGHRIIIAGGGTGGHVFPALAIARALERLEPGVQLLFVGARGKMEMTRVPEAGYRIRGLDIAGMNRSAWWKNVSLPFKILRSLREAADIVRSFSPDVVVGVGGYASFPVLRAAQKKGIPTLIQEQNSYAGKTNKLLGKKAARVCVAYAGMERFFPADRIVRTGNPVRRDIAESTVSRQEAAAAFGLDPARPTILAVGGSLGARSINLALAAGLELLVQEGIQLIWQTGEPFAAQAGAAAAGTEGIRPMAFIGRMDQAYRAADMAISRAGSTTAELCVTATPAVLVPYPYAAEDHQTQNALALVNEHAALMVKDADAAAELVAAALRLLKDGALRQQMAENLKRLAIPDADTRIAREILALT